MMIFENFAQKHRFSSIGRTFNIVEACIEHPYVVFQSLKHEYLGLIYSTTISTTSFMPMFVFNALNYSDGFREDHNLLNELSDLNSKYILRPNAFNSFVKNTLVDLTLVSWWSEFLIEEMNLSEYASYFPIRDKMFDVYCHEADAQLIYEKIHHVDKNEDAYVYLINATKAIYRDKEDIYEKLGEYFNERSNKAIDEKRYRGVLEMDEDECRNFAMNSVCLAYSKIKKRFDLLKGTVNPIVQKYQLWGIW